MLQLLKNKSNINYKYFHLFNNEYLDLKYNNNNFTINYIIYIINSDFSHFYDFYKTIDTEVISDVFLERLELSDSNKSQFFSMRFKNLFWLRINNISFNLLDYKGFITFISNNSLDINRIFLENTYLEKEFFEWFKILKWFNNLSFLNFDNNNITDKWLYSILYFLKNNSINLEYLSLINTKLNNITDLLNYLNTTDIRILDISSNNITNKSNIIDFIKDNNSIKELYLRNIEFSDNDLDDLLKLFINKDTLIYNLRLSLSKSQWKYINMFDELGNKLNINFDINFIWDSAINIYSTLYIKENNNKKIEINSLSNDSFYIIDSNNIDNDFKLLISEKNSYLRDAINLFLFDFNDYKKINYLLDNYDFNYLYIENYYITDNNFIYFLESIKKQKHKKYKINLISIELSEQQLNYLIYNFPENIFYIEVNLNKILKNRELYISKMLKNKAFIFENMELYQKIFKINYE